MKRRRKTTTSKTQSQLAVSMNRFEGIQLFKVAGERASGCLGAHSAGGGLGKRETHVPPPHCVRCY
jgi:hypothetical protein